VIITGGSFGSWSFVEPPRATTLSVAEIELLVTGSAVTLTANARACV
jgi:hypothetical protein